MAEAPVLESQHIKSRQRVQDLGEVYTPPREVAAMLDLIPAAFTAIDTSFLEPAAGNGNFLVAILERKIAAIDERRDGGSEHWYEFALLRCLASIYGVDISAENVAEARVRMLATIVAVGSLRGEAMTQAFKRAAEAIIQTNIVVGDSLNDGDKIILIAYKPLPGERFERTPSELQPPASRTFFNPAPEPLPTVHYSELY